MLQSYVIRLLVELLSNGHVGDSLPADVLWGSFVTHSFLPHGRLLNTSDIYVHQSQGVYGFL